MTTDLKLCSDPGCLVCHGSKLPKVAGYLPSDLGTIYLSSPYTHPVRETRTYRYRAALHATADLMKRGHIVFSPIVHAHPLHVREGVEGDWTFWKRIDFDFLKRMDTLVVLQIEGWADSVGVGEEMAYATSLDMRICYMRLEPFVGCDFFIGDEM